MTTRLKYLQRDLDLTHPFETHSKIKFITEATGLVARSKVPGVKPAASASGDDN